MSIEFKVSGSFAKTDAYLTRMKNAEFINLLTKYGEQGRVALAAATPVETGKTANSWQYRIERKGPWTSLIWYNTNVVDGQSVAILLQYGHGTGTGGYVPGRDYINPAIRPVLDRILEELTREVKK